MNQNQQAGSAHVIIIAALVVALIGLLGFTFWQNVIHKPVSAADAVTTYADCIKSQGSITQQTYPETCVTKSGDRFTNSSQKLEAVSLKNFCAPLEKVCFDYPSDWTVKSNAVDADTDGVAEQIAISDPSGNPWLRLQTGMGGLGGTCGDDGTGSYIKILKTHTTNIHGSYLINESAKDYVTDTAYAVSWISYNGTAKAWTINMGLNDSKSAVAVGKIGTCDLGIGVINGKNAKASGSTAAGAVEFSYYNAADAQQAYPSEAAATAALAASDAIKAYDILASARYQ